MSTEYFQAMCHACGSCPDNGQVPRQFAPSEARIETRVLVVMDSPTDYDWEDPQTNIRLFTEGLVAAGWTSDEVRDFCTFTFAFKSQAKKVPVSKRRKCGA